MTELSVARSVPDHNGQSSRLTILNESSSGLPGTVSSALLNVAMWTVLVVFTVLSIGTPLVGRGVFLATEILGDYAPWQAALEDTQASPNPYVGDTIDGAAPQVMRIVESLRHGDLPEWSPHGMGGYELGGIPNSGAYSPLALPWWVLPFSFAPAIGKLLEIAVITLGMSLFLRRLGLPQATWPIASLIYSASGFLIAWTNWPQTRVAAFVPLLFWAVDRAIGVARITAALPIGMVLAAMILGGFPAVTIYAGYAVGMYGIFRAIQLRRGSVTRMIASWAVCAAGFAIGLLIAAWQLVPFVFVNFSVIGGTERAYTGAHLPSSVLASMFFPNIAGGVRVGSWTVHPVEGLSYVGVVSLLFVSLLPLGRRIFPGQRGILLFFGLGASVLIAAMYYGGFALEILQAMPTMNNSYIGRLRVILGFFVAVLAAYGLALLIQGRPAFATWGKDAPGRLSGTVRIASCVAINLAGAWVSYRAFQEVPVEIRSRLKAEVYAITTAAIVVAVFCAAAVLMPRCRVTRVAVVVAAFGLLAPAVLLARMWWAPSAADSFYPQTQTTEFLQQRLGDQRFETVATAMLPGTNVNYRIDSFGGRAFATKQWSDLIQKVDPSAFQSRTYAWLTPTAAPSSGHNPILDRFAVAYLVQSSIQMPFGSGPSQLGEASKTAPLTSHPMESLTGIGPIRGFTLEVASAHPVVDVLLQATLVAPDGTELASTASWLRSVQGAVPVALAADDLPSSQAWRIHLSATSPNGQVPVRVTSDGLLAISVVTASDDGMRLVSTGDANVYQRLGALERVRWASSAVVSSDPTTGLSLLAEGGVPDHAVLLESSADARPVDAGSTATIEPIEGSDADTRTWRVTATGAGWLQIEDSLRRPGWTAFLDGSKTQLVAADYAAGAVFVPAGVHTVQLQFRTEGLQQGIFITMATLAALGSWALLSWVRHRRNGA